MLRRYQHYWALPLVLLLAVPLVVGAVAPAGEGVSADELRELAPAPALPRDLDAWLKLPRQVDAYLRDHFGLRRALIHAHALLSQGLLHGGNASVLIGRDGWMFFRGDDMVLQSAGLVRRDRRVTETADLIAAANGVLAARGTRLLVASPPNASTIYPDQLPRWARNPGQRTEYDLLLDALAARGVPAVDLRPALRAARAEGQVYHKHDTHWTSRGAVAGFNAVVQAASHPDWRLDAQAVLGPAVVIRGGDLARMLGLAADVTETDQYLTLAPGRRELLSPEPSGTYVSMGDQPGPTILIIGDSFTGGFTSGGTFAPMLRPHTGRVVWVHHRFCGFEWEWIERFRPDEVWWMPTERYLLCQPGVRPNGLSARVAAVP